MRNALFSFLLHGAEVHWNIFQFHTSKLKSLVLPFSSSSSSSSLSLSLLPSPPSPQISMDIPKHRSLFTHIASRELNSFRGLHLLSLSNAYHSLHSFEFFFLRVSSSLCCLQFVNGLTWMDSSPASENSELSPFSTAKKTPFPCLSRSVRYSHPEP